MATITNTVLDILAAFQEARRKPVGGPPLTPGAEQLAEVLAHKPTQVVASPIVAAILNDGRAKAIGSLTILSGDNQVGISGEGSSAPLEVRVRDANHQEFQGVDVRFSVTSGDGTVVEEIQTTDANGIAGIAAGDWTFGAKGKNRISVTAGNKAVEFRARVATSIAAQSATTQTGAPATPVVENPTVRVTDVEGQPVSGIAVQFDVLAGAGGVANPAEVNTDNDGLAATQWTLGNTAGQNILRANAGSLEVTFEATAV